MTVAHSLLAVHGGQRLRHRRRRHAGYGQQDVLRALHRLRPLRTHHETRANRFRDLLEGVPGVQAHRPPADSGSTMGGWYAAKGLYRAEELGGVSCEDFCRAVRAEGVPACAPGGHSALHSSRRRMHVWTRPLPRFILRLARTLSLHISFRRPAAIGLAWRASVRASRRMGRRKGGSRNPELTTRRPAGLHRRGRARFHPAFSACLRTRSSPAPSRHRSVDPWCGGR